MKKLLFFILFISSLIVFSDKMYAQSNERFPAGNSQKSDDVLMAAYPNPARDFIVLKVNNPLIKIKTITFYSILGMQVAEYQVNKNSDEIRLDRLRPGKYLMRYTLSDNTQKVIQIVKQ